MGMRVRTWRGRGVGGEDEAQRRPKRVKGGMKVGMSSKVRR